MTDLIKEVVQGEVDVDTIWCSYKSDRCAILEVSCTSKNPRVRAISGNAVWLGHYTDATNSHTTSLSTRTKIRLNVPKGWVIAFSNPNGRYGVTLLLYQNDADGEVIWPQK